MKKALYLLLALAFILSLAGCGCDHQWLRATGGHGQYCEKCNEYQTLNEPCFYADGDQRDCENPRLCVACGKPEEEVKAHKWMVFGNDGTQLCSVCGRIQPGSVE